MTYQRLVHLDSWVCSARCWDRLVSDGAHLSNEERLAILHQLWEEAMHAHRVGYQLQVERLYYLVTGVSHGRQ